MTGGSGCFVHKHAIESLVIAYSPNYCDLFPEPHRLSQVLFNRYVGHILTRVASELVAQFVRASL